LTVLVALRIVRALHCMARCREKDMDRRSMVRWLVVVTAAVGCSSEHAMGPPVEPSPPAKVVTRTDPASTADCPFGGVIVASGLDDNGNGKLDDAEIRTRAAVCNEAPAQPPPPILVRLVPEPSSGGHCAEGGTAVQSGPDRNGNGRLDDDEVAHTDYVCGLAVVTRLVAEPPGDRCAAGGVVFLAGPDRDGDGVLEDAEVESTEISCGDRIERDVDIRSDTDVFALKDVRVITGQVSVINMGNFSLPKLAQIGGALQIGIGSGATISLPALQSIGGGLTIHDNAVTAVDCPQLRHIGTLTILNSALHDLSGFPVLAEIAGDVAINDSPGLVSASLPPVKIAGNFQIGFNPNLASADWTVQDRLGSVRVGGNAHLATFNLSVVPVNQPGSVVGDVITDSISSLRLSANRVSSVDLEAGGIHDAVLDLGFVDKDLVVFGTTSPFGLTLSDPDHKGHVEVVGDLRIQGALEELHIPGGLIVEGLTQLANTRLRELAPVGTVQLHGALQLLGNSLLTLIAPIEVSGGLAVRNNALLPTLAFPQFGAQGEVFGDVLVTGNPVLTSAPALATLAKVHGDLALQSNPLLPNPLGPALVQVDGGLEIASTTSTELSLPNFAQVGTFVSVFGNASLTTVSMPALTTVPHELTISSNAQLAGLALGALTHAGTFSVTDNPHLPTCAVLALFARVDGEHSQSGNDDAATCAR
jgi:hypothetical protein